MKLYSKTDIGRKRQTNQDAVEGKVISSDLAWTVVCDGMGGINGGDIASKMAVDRISESITQSITPDTDEEKVVRIMKSSIELANENIFEKSNAQEELKGMGTTVVLGVVVKNNLYVMHAGDSRAYLISGPGIKQISVDHSIVQEMLDSGEITAEEARNHFQKNIITRALGINSEIKIDYNKIKLKNEDVILICTDGLSNNLEDGEIYKIFCKENLNDIPDALVEECNERGGKDNITVSIIKYEE